MCFHEVLFEWCNIKNTGISRTTSCEFLKHSCFNSIYIVKLGIISHTPRFLQAICAFCFPPHNIGSQKEYSFARIILFKSTKIEIFTIIFDCFLRRSEDSNPYIFAKCKEQVSVCKNLLLYNEITLTFFSQTLRKGRSVSPVH